MGSIFRQMPSSILEKRIPPDASHLAVLNHFGVPIKEYRDNITPIFIIIGLISEVFYLVFTLSIGNTLVTFYFSNEQGKNYIIDVLSLLSTTTLENDIHRYLGNYIYVYWLGLVLALSFLLLGYMLLARGFKQFSQKLRAYLFDEGFMVLEEGSVVLIMRWDSIATLWDTIKVIQGLRSIYIFHTYSIEDKDGKEWIITYPDLIKYIEREIAKNNKYRLQ